MFWLFDVLLSARDHGLSENQSSFLSLFIPQLMNWPRANPRTEGRYSESVSQKNESLLLLFSFQITNAELERNIPELEAYLQDMQDR